jgi:hypothetical protein
VLPAPPALLLLDPLQAARKLPAPTTAPVAAMPRRNWRRPKAAPGVSASLPSERSTENTFQ